MAIAFPAALLAQESGGSRTIRGIVRDSLQGGTGVANATVWIAMLGAQVQTDRRGRFEFRDVRPGRHIISAHAPLLDSLGLDTLRLTHDVTDRGGQEAVMATPNRARYTQRMCGGQQANDLGIIRGRILSGDSLPRATVPSNVQVEVAALWMETRLQPGQMERRELGSSTFATLDGDFILCGVPIGIETVLRITNAESGDTARVFARIDRFVSQRDLTMARPSRSSAGIVIAGRILTADGRPIANGSIADAVSGDLLGRSDQNGQFALQRPAMSQQLMMRAVGYQPVFVDVEPQQAHRPPADVRLEPVPQYLATMAVSGRRMSAEELAFETRRRTGLGSYLNEETLNKAPSITPNYVASQSMIARTEAGRGGRRQLMLWRGAGPCRPRFYIDGIDNGKIDVDDEELFLHRAKRIEIYRAAFAPPEYNDFDGCGSIVIWTR